MKKIATNYKPNGSATLILRLRPRYSKTCSKTEVVPLLTNHENKLFEGYCE